MQVLRQWSFRKKGQQAKPVLTLRSSHSKAVSMLASQCENTGDLVIGVVRVAK